MPKYGLERGFSWKMLTFSSLQIPALICFLFFLGKKSPQKARIFFAESFFPTFCCLGTAYVVSVMFVYRYAQTVEHRLAYVLSNFWYFFFGYLLYSLFMLVVFLLPLNSQVIFTQESRNAFREDQKIYKLISNEPLVFSLNVSAQ
jgi:ABC-type multidrug transport system fused ATPase/permease subunit